MKRGAWALSLCAGCAFALPPPSSSVGGDAGASKDAALDAGARDGGARDVVFVDASGDVGAVDAAAADDGPAVVGRADAGVTEADARGSDGGAVDAGTPDTGPVDTGPVDTGPVDTGPADTGPVDTGPVDSGAIDAGAPPLTVVDVDAGDDFTCAVLSDGRLYCWGKNNEGQLGLGGTGDRATPARVTSTERFVDVSAGGQHACAISATGALWCWGRNNRGQLGDGTTTDRESPVRVMASGVTSVAAGGEHTCAVASSRVYCWGKGDNGQLGDGLRVDRTSPTAVPSLTAVEVSVGEAHSCARVTGASPCEGSPTALRCWGKNDHLQVGGGAGASVDVPAAITPEGTTCEAVSAVSANRNNTCATWGDTLYCWGENADGQLGVGVAAPSLPAAVTFSGAAGPAAPTAAVGGMFAFALVREADALRPWSWGKNMEGQLALTTSGPDRPTPTRAVGLAGYDIAQVSAGIAHACARTRAGDLACWGAGGNGRLGTGSNANAAAPARVTF